MPLTQSGACTLVLNAFVGIGATGPISLVSLIFSFGCPMLKLSLWFLLLAIKLFELVLVVLSGPLEAVLAFLLYHLSLIHI